MPHRWERSHRTPSSGKQNLRSAAKVVAQRLGGCSRHELADDPSFGGVAGTSLPATHPWRRPAQMAQQSRCHQQQQNHPPPPNVDRLAFSGFELPITSALRKGGCFRMGWWRFAKRKQFCLSGPSWGSSWSRLGASWGPLGRREAIWGRPGAVWKLSVAVQMNLRAILGLSEGAS